MATVLTSGLGAFEEMLLARGLVTPEQLSASIREARAMGRPTARILVESNIVPGSSIVALIAESLGYPFVELSEESIDPVAVASVPESTARRHTCMPLRFEQQDTLVLAMMDPSNVVALDDVAANAQKRIRPVIATRVDLLDAIGRNYRLERAAEDLAQVAAAEQEAADRTLEEATAEGAGADDAPIIRLVNMLMMQAISDRASDIHIEPEPDRLRVRYRIDGVLNEVMSPSKALQPGIVSRLKIMADINIAERRIPQDGRIGIAVQAKQIDVRVSTLPTVHGEKVVMRLLDRSSVLLKLKDLGFLPENFARYERSFTKPYGTILVTGPTGSGKSTTLYATLNILNRPEVNIVTVEDPVEYRLPGIAQVQTNPRAGLTFASALRSILRQDPDIILVGEIRDRETAQIAIESALTGHLVLATLHTNDAPSAIIRLTEMGVEPFLVTSAVDCILAQRLARRLCGRCKQPYEPEETIVRTDGPSVAYRPVGCPACGGTGYRGRVALQEVMEVTEEIERLTIERTSSEEIGRAARDEGMTTLREDGMRKVGLGITSVEEILRVVA